ncbi:MAG: prefoldin subunit, partial [Candidatus Altiarchaeota archaeon]|nr:prefoldin subunit [Candidatus Altiarchaeota archaeon]
TELQASTGDVYKSVGPILIKSNKTALKKDMEERGSSAEARVKVLEGQEHKLATKLQDLQKDLQSGLRGVQDVPDIAQ